MGLLRPGGLELTEYALKKAGAKAGDKLLDIGCGDGTAAAFIRERLGIDVIGIDIDKEAVEKAKEKGVDARVGDAFALDFPSRGFELVLMECVFSILERQEEAIHEAFCMLKPGGHLILNDVYCREPDMERYRKDYHDAMALFRRPREEGDCESGEKLPSPYLQDGAVVLEGLNGLLEELEMETIFFEDRTDDLKTFAAQAVLDYGSVEEYCKAEGSWNCCGMNCKTPGYFLLIAKKN